MQRLQAIILKEGFTLEVVTKFSFKNFEDLDSISQLGLFNFKLFSF